jgi:RNA polymerase sigma factor (TIGR02999 family)
METDQPKLSDQLFQQLYEELKRAAHHQLRGGKLTAFDTTGLVHEAFLKLHGHGFNDRAHFYRLSARVMRQIVCNHLRHRAVVQADQKRLLAEAENESQMALADVLALEQAMLALLEIDERMTQVVELHCFVGLSIPEIAQVLGVHERTVFRDWRSARAFLKNQLSAQTFSQLEREESSNG